jgi:hypothetical protein
VVGRPTSEESAQAALIPPVFDPPRGLCHRRRGADASAEAKAARDGAVWPLLVAICAPFGLVGGSRKPSALAILSAGANQPP